MSNWEKWTDEGDRTISRAKGFNKNISCKRNKNGNKNYGPHIYDNDDYCKLCGHAKKEKGDNTL